MSHRCRRRGAVPVTLIRRAPNHVSRPNFFDWAVFALGPATACGNDERLPERVRVPVRAGAWLEGNAGAGDASWRRWRAQRIDTNTTGEVIGRTPNRGLRSSMFKIHELNPRRFGSPTGRSTVCRGKFIPTKRPMTIYCAVNIAQRRCLPRGERPPPDYRLRRIMIVA